MDIIRKFTKRLRKKERVERMSRGTIKPVRAQPRQTPDDFAHITVANLKHARIRPGGRDYRGDWKMERTFSAPSLYFFNTLFFCCFSSSRSRSPFIGGIGEPLIVSTAGSPLTDGSDESLGAPTEITDSLDFSDGVMAVCDGDGVRKPAVDIVDAADNVVEAEGEAVNDFADRDDGGGLFCRRNCLGCLRKVRPGVRPRRCLSEGVGDAAGSEPLRSESIEIPETERGPFLLGVLFLKTASLYRSTTPRAKRLVGLAPLRSSTSRPPASTKSQSSSSSRSVLPSSSVAGSGRSLSRAGMPDFSLRLRTSFVGRILGAVLTFSSSAVRLAAAAAAASAADTVEAGATSFSFCS
ncbi:hypothetical protein GSI_05899 [Ganoderma sinense ZZ0214-1]|uniref:Uncharacterized protein n=1 Tax=Ganoderma sinense ZZ0214-1 TaxID=1077348 RepID=A0A2G8SBS7_9APHY|nr:hypothetical protein GSI_05899 [Ganoderma sinense ZZ0214-1]